MWRCIASGIVWASLQEIAGATSHSAVNHAKSRSRWLALQAGGSGVDLSALCVISAKSCWVVHVDALVLNDDGNVLGALSLAARAALATTRIPKVRGMHDAHKCYMQRCGTVSHSHTDDHSFWLDWQAALTSSHNSVTFHHTLNVFCSTN